MGKKASKKRPSKAKKAAELTDDEALRRLFPKAVRDEAKREAKKVGYRGSKRHEPEES